MAARRGLLRRRSLHPEGRAPFCGRPVGERRRRGPRRFEKGLLPVAGPFRGNRLAGKAPLPDVLRRPPQPHRPHRPAPGNGDPRKGGVFRGLLRGPHVPLGQADQDVHHLPERRGLRRLPDHLHGRPGHAPGEVRRHAGDETHPAALQGGHRRRVRHRRPVPFRDPGGLRRPIERTGSLRRGWRLAPLRDEILLLGHARRLRRRDGKARRIGKGRPFRRSLLASGQPGKGDPQRLHH